MIGPIILANVWALDALTNRLSFNSSNSSLEICSWLNTLMTRCPFILSSTKPVIFARSSCCRIKYFPLFPPIFLDTRNIIPIITTANKVNAGLKTSMAIKVTTIVKDDINTWGIDWLIICLSVSVSFVYKLMMEPLVFWSKYRIGRVCICSNISSRTRFSTPWPITTIRRVYRNVANTPSKKIHPSIPRAVYSSEKFGLSCPISGMIKSSSRYLSDKETEIVAMELIKIQIKTKTNWTL